MAKLTPSKFLGSLYKKEDVMPQTEYDESVTRLVVRNFGNTMIGDQALQSLLVNYTIENAESLDEVKKLGAALAGIKQRAITAVTEAFPKASLDEITSAARASGYDVQVLE